MDEKATIERNIGVVRTFLRGWDERDVDLCMSQCTEDMVYWNKPLPPLKGPDVRTMIASIFEPAKRVEFILHNIFGHGNKVITERRDQWDWDGSGTWQLVLPVCGMFELTDDGKIYEWREYYDNEHWTQHGGPSLEL